MANIKEKLLLKDILSDMKKVITIPIYQRGYDWDKEDIIKLVEDVVIFDRTFKEEVEEKYYLGNLLIREQESKQQGITEYIIIDGQQRITSTLLIIAALRNTKNISDEEAEKYLMVQSYKDNKKMKLNRMKDADVIRKIFNDDKNINFNDKNTRVYENYKAVLNWLNENPKNASKAYGALKRIVIVEVGINPSNETKVFETINSTGKKLTPADLIKAFTLFGVHNFSEEDSKKLEQYFEENIISRLGSLENVSDFYRYYVAIEGNTTLANRSSREIYYMFKAINREYRYDNKEEVEELIAEVGRHAEIFERINGFKYTKPEYKLYKKVYASNSKTYYPLAHRLVEEYAHDFPEEDMGKVMRIIAKIALFRSIGNEPDKNITTTILSVFPDFLKFRNGKSTTLEDFENFIDLMPFERNYGIPNYEKLREKIQSSSHYSENKGKLKNILFACEVFSNKRGTPVDLENDFELEHIFPQTQTEWEKHMEAEEIIKMIIKRDNIGNMTLLSKGINISISNSFFPTKLKGKIVNGKQQEGILSDTIKLSQYFVNMNVWDSQAIIKRSIDLLDIIYDHFNENREVLERIENPIKTEKDADTEALNKTNMKKWRDQKYDFIDYYNTLKDNILEKIPSEIKLHKVQPVSWWQFGIKTKEMSKTMNGSITTRRNKNKEKIMAITIDWDKDEKARQIKKLNNENEFNKLFDYNFVWKDPNKKGWGFVIELPVKFNGKYHEDLPLMVLKAFKDIVDNIDNIMK